MENNICKLIALLPKGWEEKCLEQKIIERKREIKTPGDLMLLCLFHLVNGCSLMDTSIAAGYLNIGSLTDVAFMKRFMECGDWFKWISSAIARKGQAKFAKPEWLKGYTVVAYDASEVKEQGCTGQQFRLHYGLDIFSMCTVSHKITKLEVGETMLNFDVGKGFIAMGDRAYGTVNGIMHCLASGADFIFRLRMDAFQIFSDKEERVDFLEKFKKLRHGESAEFHGHIKTPKGGRQKVRVCAMRKSEEDCRKARERVRGTAKRKGQNLREGTEKFNEYIVLVTSLPPKVAKDEVLATYRLRWQVENYFKRLKSVLGFGELPKKREKASLAWLNGKMMVALLIETLVAGSFFSLKWKEESEAEYLARDQDS
ncbi:MAG: transposase [Fibromonadaceae bacterium]|jgi:hypothetical protein|nr:transposase [Fibromonadaceae bacterium]